MGNRRWRALVLCGALLSVSATPSQGPEVKNVMREKLQLAQRILEAVVISDWVNLETNSEALARLTSDRRWTALKYPEYAKQSAAFVRAVEALRSAAVERDLNKAPKAYATLTLQCVECHRYMARQRLAH
jgi:cytochrome c556